MPRFTGGAAPEAVRIEIRDLAPALVETFDQDTRQGTLLDPTGESINLNAYEWGPDRNRPDTFTFSVTDAERKFIDALDEGYGVRAGFDNFLTDCILSFDMETLDSTADMLDLTLAGNDGVITGTTDVTGFWGRAREFTAETDKIVVTGFNYDGFTSWGHGATVRIGNAFATRTIQNIIGLDTSTANAQGSLRLSGPVGGLPDTIQIYINTTTTGFQIFSRAFTFVLGETYFIFATWDGANLRIFVDGAQVGTSGPATGSLVSGTTFTVGHRSSGDSQTFNEQIDEVISYKNRAPTSIEVTDIYKRLGRAPRYYFDGKIRNIKNDSGITTVTAHGLMKNLTTYDVYDIIYEGSKSADTVLPSFFYRKINGFFGTDADHTGDHIKLQETDESTNLNAADKVFSELIEFPSQSEWSPSAGDLSMPSYRIAVDDLNYNAAEFIATAKQVDRVGVLVNINGVASPNEWRIFIADEDGNLIGDAEAVVIADSSTIYKWVYVTLSGVGFTYELNIGEKYYLAVQALELNVWNLGTPLKWARNGRGSRKIKARTITPSPTDTWQTTERGMCVLFLMENNWEALEVENYEIKAASVGDVLVAEVNSDVLSGTTNIDDAEIMPEFFRCTYFYSQGTQHVSDVISHVLGKAGLNAIFGGAGGLGSDATTEDLGLYIPQGGTAWEHVTQLGALVEDRPRFTPPAEVRFERWPEPTIVENSSFEKTDPGATTAAKWTGGIVSGAGSFAVSEVQQFSGDKSFRIQLNLGATSVEVRVYQDIEAFDPVVSGLDGNNMEFYAFREGTWDAITELRVKVYDYGSFDNSKVLTTKSVSDLTLNDWTRVPFLVERSSFRLEIALKYFDTIDSLLENEVVFIDDVFPHPENQRSYFLKDASYNDADYISGFIPGTRSESAAVGVHLFDDIDGPPDIQKEFARSSVNESIVIGAKRRLGEPIIAIAKNPARQAVQGVLLRVKNQESLKSIEDAYKSARQQLRNESRARSKISMVGQYPFLYGRIIRLFFPDHGLQDAMPAEVTSLRMGPSYTDLRFNWSEVEEFEDVEKTKEREEFLSGAFDLDPNESLVYFTSINLPTTIDPSAVFDAKLKEEISGGLSSGTEPLVTRDTRDGSVPSVWSFIAEPDPVDFITTSTNLWKSMSIRNSGSVEIAVVDFPQMFAGLENMWIIVWLFAQ